MPQQRGGGLGARGWAGEEGGGELRRAAAGCPRRRGFPTAAGRGAWSLPWPWALRAPARAAAAAWRRNRRRSCIRAPCILAPRVASGPPAGEKKEGTARAYERGVVGCRSKGAADWGPGAGGQRTSLSPLRRLRRHTSCGGGGGGGTARSCHSRAVRAHSTFARAAIRRAWASSFVLRALPVPHHVAVATCWTRTDPARACSRATIRKRHGPAAPPPNEGQPDTRAGRRRLTKKQAIAGRAARQPVRPAGPRLRRRARPTKWF